MKLTGSQILIETLIEQGVKDVFGYPGGQILHIYDALYQASDRIRCILPAHEQGGAHAADGYARATGKVGVVIATSGPGATNLVTGIATAMLDSVPMVAITGNVPSAQIGKDSFQEVNITGVTMPITKHNYFVTDVAELADTVREAFRIAISGRPGPVLIDITKDVQMALCEYEKKPAVEKEENRRPNEEALAAAVRMINAAERPYLYIGGGAHTEGIGAEVLQLAERIDGYVGATLMGLSLLPSEHPRFLGMQGMHGRYAASVAGQEADLIIGIGVRFGDRATGRVSKYAPKAKILQLDIDPSEIGKNVPAALGVVGDIQYALAEILRRCEKRSRPAWRRRIEVIRADGMTVDRENEAKAAGRLTPKKIFDIINAYTDENTTFATDVGQHQMWTAQYVKLTRPRQLLTSGGLGTMGYGLGAGIGGYIGRGGRCVLITGDGSFAMNLNELATAVSYQVPMAVVLFNNNTLGMVRQWQTLFFGGRHAGSDLCRSTDYVALSRAFGADGERVDSAEAFEAAFRRAKEANKPYLIEVAIDRDEMVLPMTPPGGTADNMIVTKEE